MSALISANAADVHHLSHIALIERVILQAKALLP